MESIPMKSASITPTSQGSSKWGNIQVIFSDQRLWVRVKQKFGALTINILRWIKDHSILFSALVNKIWLNKLTYDPQGNDFPTKILCSLIKMNILYINSSLEWNVHVKICKKIINDNWPDKMAIHFDNFIHINAMN